jgi:hypothetical protein
MTWDSMDDNLAKIVKNCGSAEGIQAFEHFLNDSKSYDLLQSTFTSAVRPSMMLFDLISVSSIVISCLSTVTNCL